MRPVVLADLEAALRVALHTAPAQRVCVVEDLCARAQIADSFRKRYGRLHPQHGDGTLMAAALAQQTAPRPAAYDVEALGCLHIIITTLLNKYADQEQ